MIVNHGAVLAHLKRTKILAVLRGSSTDAVIEAGVVLAEAGIEVLEVTFTVPGCAYAIAELKKRLPQATIGAGTVTTHQELEEALAAGADFLVTPGTTPTLLRALSDGGTTFFPGVLTPSEVMAAQEAGAQAVKLFPGSFTGPPGLKALRGPFPGLQVVPTGGVSPSNVAQWFDAGAVAVGAGSDLAPPDAVASANHELLRANAANWLDAVESYRTTNTDVQRPVEQFPTTLTNRD